MHLHFVMDILYDNFVLRRRDIILSFLALYYNEAVLSKCLWILQLSFNWDCYTGDYSPQSAS